MKKNKGFTLIELLAVIVILAVIALIAVPQVIKILNKSRLSAAEDSAYGIVKSAESYVANFMLKNDGSMPSKNLEFECSNSGCVLKTTDLGDYDLTDLNELSFKGVKPTSGTVTIEDNGQTIKASNLVINGFKCNYPNNEGKVSCGKGTNSDVIVTTKLNLEHIAGTSAQDIDINEDGLTLDGYGLTYKLSLPAIGYIFDWRQVSPGGSISFCDLSDNCQKLPYNECESYAGSSCAIFGDTYTNTELGYIKFYLGSGITINLKNITYNGKDVDISFVPTSAPVVDFYSGDECVFYQGALKNCDQVSIENNSIFSNNVYAVVATNVIAQEIKINDEEWKSMGNGSIGRFYSFNNDGVYKFKVRSVYGDNAYSKETDYFYLTIKK